MFWRAEKQSVGAACAMAGTWSQEKNLKGWWSEAASAGGQVCSGTEPVSFCVLVITAELCHWVGFVLNGVCCEIVEVSSN